MELKNLFCLYTKHGTIKKIALLCFCSLFVYNLWGQEVSIYGKVIDKNGERLGFATIILTDKNDSLLHVTISDSVGNYLLASELSADVYYVKASFVGMEDYIIPINIEEEKTTYLQDITLIGSVLLDGVVVTARRQVIKQYADKMEVTVDNDIINNGNSVLDVLEKSPGVVINRQDGDIQLMGKRNVLVLINGRQTHLSAQALISMLASIPSTNVSTIDLISSPSAKYESEGKGGIIDIKMKTFDNEGIKGSLISSFGYGKYGKYTHGGTMYYTKKKVSLYGGVNYLYDKTYNNLDATNMYDSLTRSITTNLNNSKSNLSYRAGIEYNIDSTNIIGINFDGNFVENRGKGTSNTENSRYSIMDSILQQDILFKDNRKNFHSNIFHEHLFKKKGGQVYSEFDFLAFHTHENNNYEGKALLHVDSVYRFWEMKNPAISGIQVFTLKSDFVFPLKDSSILEFGYKSSIVAIDYLGSYEIVENIKRLSNESIFNYNENINATYVSLSKQIGKKLNSKLGLRNEYATTYAKNEKTIIDNTALQFFPSLFIMYPFSEKQTYKISYNKRITRPEYDALNPFYYYIDPNTIHSGNPQLQPTITHNIEFGHIYKNFITTNVFFNYNIDEYNQIPKELPNSNTIVYVNENLGNSKQIGLFTGGYKQLKNWWGIYSNFTAFYFNNSFENGDFKESYTINSYLSSQFFLKRDVKIELSGFYQSPFVSGIYKGEQVYLMNFAMSKLFGKNQNIVLNFKIDDVFNSKNIYGHGISNGMIINLKNTSESRQVWVTLSWNFGNNKIEDLEKRGTGIEDEKERILKKRSL